MTEKWKDSLPQENSRKMVLPTERVLGVVRMVPNPIRNFPSASPCVTGKTKKRLRSAEPHEELEQKEVFVLPLFGIRRWARIINNL